ncbi:MULTISPECIES: MmgE/PrpD family protein [unclassified Enterococcus]|uniref:MmgE/PrpD family protein n=1 Tax=unclassified Enterococcus TaxID=2608891 RepID=UPI001554CBB1|nr:MULTISPECIES: MmgE/PrpD family protein [unclassified Enterococcus]MBS7578095.1 MmgE/PrpD family protein [Enterococcus sp. MMGLQ5-2]MBS7585355.1 MmgE/PrpD family protein [Enterococcus sp. MMGLQ5-1]NPD13212.1 propanediol utilization protein [Enterococcus sp. MMGLQ5-1]NPD37926.1 propanediol utilization protein [Enterococcus sp. MMGLQ5-2]
MADYNTELLLDCIEAANIKSDSELFSIAKLAFIDYLASYFLALDEPVIQQFAQVYQQSEKHNKAVGTSYHFSNEEIALFYGFTAHYLDIDDVQPNIQGHPSAVIFSALLAVSKSEHSWQDFFESYILGLEVEGCLGKLVNPQLKIQGWHATSVLGNIGAAVAIGHLKQLSRTDLTRLISLAATQSMGMSFQFGSDIKPLHAGLAAQAAVFSYQLVTKTQIKTDMAPFRENGGWLKTLNAEQESFKSAFASFLSPGEIIQPGLWFKRFPFCSAAMTGYDAAEQLWQMGIRIQNLKAIEIHFSPNQDQALRFKKPKNGIEGKFSIEYIIWQVLSFGEVKNEFFSPAEVPRQFIIDLPKIKRYYDLPRQKKTSRFVKLSVITNNDLAQSMSVKIPKGAPENPLSIEEIINKLKGHPLQQSLNNFQQTMALDAAINLDI